MSEIDLTQMLEIQRKMRDKYGHVWGPLNPDVGKQQLLWMMVEAGEVADIMKKRGDAAIMENAEVRAHFVEEMCDVLMYFTDVMLCYDVTAEELTQAYRAKYAYNLRRWDKPQTDVEGSESNTGDSE